MKIEKHQGKTYPVLRETTACAQRVRAKCTAKQINLTRYLGDLVAAHMRNPVFDRLTFDKLGCANLPTRTVGIKDERRDEFLCALKADPLQVAKFKEAAFAVGVRPVELLRYIVRKDISYGQSRATAQPANGVRVYEAAQWVDAAKTLAARLNMPVFALVRTIVNDYLASPEFDRAEFDKHRIRHYTVQGKSVQFAGEPRNVFLTQLRGGHPAPAVAEQAALHGVLPVELLSYMLRRSLKNAAYIEDITHRFGAGAAPFPGRLLDSLNIEPETLKKARRM